MKQLKYVLLGLVLLVGLAVLAACDSDSDGGGGAPAPVAGYSAADLAGTWRLTFRNPQNPAVLQSANISFNQSGEVSAFWMVGNPTPFIGMKGALVVEATGAFSGDTILRQGPTLTAIVWYAFRFKSKTLAEGKWYIPTMPAGQRVRRIHMEKFQ